MNFRQMTDQKLVHTAKVLCKKEREINAEIIEALIEIQRRELHLKDAKGKGSLFVYARDVLGLPNSNAQGKIDAVALSKSVPDMKKKIETGELTMTCVKQVSAHLRTEQRETGKKVEDSVIETLVKGASEKKNKREAEIYLAKKSSSPWKPIQETAKVVPGGRMVLQLEVDEDTLELFEQIRMLLSHHKNEKGTHFSKGDVFKHVVQFYLSKEHPAHKGERKTRAQTKFDFEVPSETQSQTPVPSGTKTQTPVPSGTKSQTPVPSGTKTNNPVPPRTRPQRSISASTWREVWRKYDGRCCFRNPRTGERCNSRFRVQVEHIIPVCKGGGSEIENLELLCAAHNLYRARHMNDLPEKEEAQTETPTFLLKPNLIPTPTRRPPE